jgi:hypothetical protein
MSKIMHWKMYQSKGGSSCLKLWQSTLSAWKQRNNETLPMESSLITKYYIFSYEACHAKITIHLSIEWIASNTSNEYNIHIMKKKNPMLNVGRCTTSYLLARLVYLWCLVFLTQCDWLNITYYNSKARLRRLTRWGLALWQPSS